jgi:hypothetical protein
MGNRLSRPAFDSSARSPISPVEVGPATSRYAVAIPEPRTNDLEGVVLALHLHVCRRVVRCRYTSTRDSFSLRGSAAASQFDLHPVVLATSVLKNSDKT